ncbi:MAG TPA: PD-(D/E)XK nuclease family protein [Candidatus Polarisedimenticolaceae bacterium]|nr:PD-(D/E)XK nuclease family protein [Candidatus Polarisedimenticolaceae bacterium]
MKILGHVDVRVLEQELLRVLVRDHPSTPGARSFVVVPTRRLVTHLSKRLVRDGGAGAWLGVEFLTFHGLARSILVRAGARVPRVLAEPVRRSALRSVLAGLRQNAWAAFVERRPGALGRLARAVDDLREAGVLPAELETCAGDHRGNRSLAEIYAAYHEALVALGVAGVTDGAGFIAAATPHAGEFAAASAQLLVYGAYEWLGVHLELIRELGRGREPTVFVPVAPGAEVTRYAAAYLARHLPAETIVALDDPVGAERLPLRSLYDEHAEAEPVPPGRIVLRHVQGATAECEGAAFLALDAVAAGTRPDEVAIVARSLTPYAAPLERAFDDRGLNWTSSLTVPVRRHPIARDLLLSVRVVDEAFPRRAVVEWLRSPRLRFTSLPGVSHPPPRDVAERYSRLAGIVSGFDEWTVVLPDWAARGAVSPSRRRRVARIAAAVRGLRDVLSGGAATWSRHAANLDRLIDLLQPAVPEARDEGAIAALRLLVRGMAELESLLGQREPVAFGEARRWLEDACSTTALATRERDDGGIRVLDAMQFRCLTHDRVLLIGTNSGVFPRLAREDPVLGDPLRSELRERFDRPLTLAAEADDEEKLLLALILGAAGRRVDLSWQRADEGGRARTPSLALRQVLRLTRGSPEMSGLACDGVVGVPSHPTQWLRFLAGELGLLAPEHAPLLDALTGAGDDHFERLSRCYPELADGLTMLRATQDFAIRDPAFDARPRTARPFETISVSRFERLGRCPLSFFFHDVLGVQELDPETTAATLPLNVIGNLVHDALERLYRRLAERGPFEADRADELRRAAREWLDEERGRLFGEVGDRLMPRLPGLWSITAEAWHDALAAFVDRDLERLAYGGWVLDGLEQPIEGSIDLDDAPPVRVRGRLDRRLVRGDESIVGDYKTSGGLARRGEVLWMLRGQTLQVPLYGMLAGGRARVELLGVGPAYDPLDAESARLTFSGLDPAALDGFRETLRVLIGFARSGRFPLHSDRHCSWCCYRPACRRTDPPSLHRETLYDDGKRLAALLRKTLRRPRLDPAEGDP